jgi:hydrogenase maturation protease
VGLGNLLMTDDGVGVHAVRKLKTQVPSGVTAVEVGTAVLDALHLLEKADRVVALDAVQAGGAPGTIYAFRLPAVNRAEGQRSSHELDLRYGLRLLKKQPEIVVLGVEPETIRAGLTLSPTVKRALVPLTKTARKLVDTWLQGKEPDLAGWVRPATALAGGVC